MSELSTHAFRRSPWRARLRFAAGLLGLAAILTGPGLAAAAGSSEPGAPPLDKSSRPVRITIPSLGVDLPVVSSERNVRGNPRGYPLCDVAQYWTEFDLPGAPGTAWIYAHAQPGMFLPLHDAVVEASRAGLLHRTIALQLRDGRVLDYVIDTVRPQARDRAIADIGGARGHRLVVQTSTGPPGTIAKLQVSARLVDAGWTDEAPPEARPRPCSAPAPRTTVPAVDPTMPTAEIGASTTAARPAETSRFAIGSGVLLLGAGLVAVTLFRRGG